jgi:hypothetical protein
MPKVAADAVPLSPADAERERAHAEARATARFRRRLLDARPEPEVVEEEPEPEPLTRDGSPNYAAIWAKFGDAAEPQEPAAEPDPALLRRREQAREVRKQLADLQLRAPLEGNLAALDDTPAEERRLRQEALQEARREYAGSPEAAELAGAELALRRVQATLDRITAEHRDADAAFQAAIAEGCETVETHGRLAAAIAAGQTARALVKDAQQRVREATAAAALAWKDTLARVEDRGRRAHEQTLAAHAKRQHRAFVKALAQNALALTVKRHWTGNPWTGPRALAPYTALEHAVAPEEEEQS